MHVLWQDVTIMCAHVQRYEAHIDSFALLCHAHCSSFSWIQFLIDTLHLCMGLLLRMSTRCTCIYNYVEWTFGRSRKTSEVSLPACKHILYTRDDVWTSMGHVACIEVDFGNHKQFRVRIPQFRRLEINSQATLILIQTWYWTVEFSLWACHNIIWFMCNVISVVPTILCVTISSILCIIY